MDYSSEIDNLISQLTQLGFDEEKKNQLLDLASEELIDDAVDYLGENADDAVLEEVSLEMEKELTTTQEAQTRLNMLLEKAYGNEAENKKGEFIVNYLTRVIEDTKQAKDLYDRYQAGDPSAIAAVKAQEGNPDAQEIIDKM